MWGLFFEDINLGADGGLYAEMVKNRSFEFDTPLMGWKEEKKDGSDASILIVNKGSESPRNPRHAHIAMRSGKGVLTLYNEGFRGMGFKSGGKYEISFLARKTGDSSPIVEVELQNEKAEKIGSGTVMPESRDWKKYKILVSSNASVAKGRLAVLFKGRGDLEIDMISCFPTDTWKNRPGGLRADLVQMLADIKPGFLRFPGGCIVEGRVLETRYQWKKTVGDVQDRETLINRWNTEFAHKPAPDYFQSFGLGFFEYFQLSEDIGAEPLPILNCGMACQFNSAEVVPIEQLDQYIQDALDLIEFANGGANTKWGKLRVDMGHPASFNMKYLGIGNEQWGEQYIERFTLFAKAIKARHPEIKLISSAGPSPDGPLFNYLNDTLRAMQVDLIDEHYYRTPDWFLKNARRYDNYDRKGPKIFAGEYAAQSKGVASPLNKNSWACALAEAAFMTGLERNADVVQMTSYAPLFAHAEGWQWTPDLIWFNNLHSYGTPNYYVQKLYGNNKGSQVIPILIGNETVAGQKGMYASATLDKTSNEVIVKIVNTSSNEQATTIAIDGARRLSSKATLLTLQHQNPDQLNSFEEPLAVSPKAGEVNVNGKMLRLRLQPASFTIIRVGL
jgi:alpha-L-arabinofuranosidase